jgi:putative transposase
MQSTQESNGPVAPMRIVSGVTAGMLRQARHPAHQLSREARIRLACLDHYRLHHNASLTCRHFGISRQTFYRWKRRFQPLNLRSLENRSPMPTRRRQPTWTTAQVLAVQAMRERYPRWGKAKLQVLLAREGHTLSVSMVGRILRSLKRRGALHEPPGTGIRARRRPFRRPYAVRKPRAYLPTAPGDLVEIDTLDVRPVAWRHLKHFSAHDVVSRWNVLELHANATAKTAAQALEAVIARMPFPVRAIQVDGGSEYMAEFEQACKDRGIQLFALPPRSPKLNGGVERAHRTHVEEFYDCVAAPPTVAGLSPQLRAWETVYNTIRPHQALGYLTPAEFLASYHHPSTTDQLSRRY